MLAVDMGAFDASILPYPPFVDVRGLQLLVQMMGERRGRGAGYGAIPKRCVVPVVVDRLVLMRLNSTYSPIRGLLILHTMQ